MEDIESVKGVDGAWRLKSDNESSTEGLFMNSKLEYNLCKIHL